MVHAMRRALCVLILLVVGCGGRAASPTPTYAPAGFETEAPPGIYEQTWTTDYADTTCGDWARRMDDHQRFVMAGDILVALRRSDDIEPAMPSDRMIREY